MTSSTHAHAPRNILITGGSQGIGLAMALQFIASGDHVTICASSEVSVKQALEIEPRLDARVCDVRDLDALTMLARDVQVLRAGRIDILINNAGKYIPGQLHSEPEGVLEDMLLMNLLSAYRLTRLVVPGMIQRREGTIVNICSTASFTPYPNGGSYGVSKFALLGFTKTLREELKSHNIRVVAVMPGATRTASWDGSGVAPERLMDPHDVAHAIVSACSLGQSCVIEEIVMRPMAGDIS